MSWGRLSTRPLAPEDDWFVEPDVGPSAGHEEPRERRTSDPEPREGAHPGSPRPRGAEGLGGERSGKLVAAAVTGAILFIGGALVGTLAARALSGSDETTTSTLTRTTTVTTTSPTTTPTTTTPTTSSPAALPQGVVLRRGDEGGDVSEVQAALVELGYSASSVDGKFGPATAQAVQVFQQSSGLKQDGVVGPATLAALSAALNGQ
jgi:hypothetical protein